ncbi:MFS-type transporter SLC18B1-like [Ornithodoros turicata]|uniref:MFS-type transporter SLC18B1-like n=1 Tax=Ornithodoros turicata TaxID=34597 RepID=UPI0031396861
MVHQHCSGGSSTGYVYDNQEFESDQVPNRPEGQRMNHADSLEETPSTSGYSSTSSSTRAPEDRSLLGRFRRKAWLLPIIHTQFWFAACFSLMAPYFPHLAESKGIAAWKYGFVFSSFKMAMLLGSICGDKLMMCLTPSRVYLGGQAGFFSFMVMFGAIYWSPGGDVLLGLAIAVALFGGFMSAMYSVSMYSIVTERFTANTGIIIACMECLWGIGGMTGSALGGVLIDLWKYPLPFFVIGGVMMLSLPVIARRGPIPRKHRRVITGSSSAEHVRYYKAFCDPIFLADMVTVMLSWIIMAFNEPTLEPYLHQFHLTSTQTGAVFTVQFASYCIATVPAGILCSYHLEECFMFFGQCLTATAYLILGPAPFLPGPPRLWMIYLSQVFTGVGMSAQFVCSFSHALKRLIKKGYPDTIRTSGFVSSCMFTFLVFGAITTPPIAGYLVEKLGYRLGSMPLFAILTLWSVVTLTLWINSLCCSKSAAPRTDESLAESYPVINTSVEEAVVDYGSLQRRTS